MSLFDLLHHEDSLNNFQARGPPLSLARKRPWDHPRPPPITKAIQLFGLPPTKAQAPHSLYNHDGGHTTGQLVLFTHLFTLFARLSRLTWHSRQSLQKRTCIIVIEVLDACLCWWKWEERTTTKKINKKYWQMLVPHVHCSFLQRRQTYSSISSVSREGKSQLWFWSSSMKTVLWD